MGDGGGRRIWNLLVWGDWGWRGGLGGSSRLEARVGGGGGKGGGRERGGNRCRGPRGSGRWRWGGGGSGAGGEGGRVGWGGGLLVCHWAEGWTSISLALLTSR